MQREHKGAVSIFLVIILMASFMFGGFFIDSARILVAKRKVKNVVNSAARSTLSYYDDKLMGEYGLFAFDKGIADSTFKRYINTNLSKTSDKGMRFFDYNVKKVSVEAKRPLKDAELERQIVEYEKYRGPVNITMGVIEKIKGIFGADKVEEVSTAKKSIDAIKNNFKDKDNILKNAGKAITVTIKDEIKEGIKKDVSTITAKWVNETLYNNLYGEKGKFAKIESEISKAKEQLEYLKKQRDNYVDAATDLCDGASQENSSASADEYLNQDKTIKQQADDEIEKLEKNIAETEKILSGVKTDMETARGQLSGIVTDLEKKRSELAVVDFKLNGDANTIGAYKKRSNAKEDKEEREKTYNTYLSNIEDCESIINSNQKLKEELVIKNNEIEELLANTYNIQVSSSAYENDLWRNYKEIVSKNNRTNEEQRWLEETEKKYKKSVLNPVDSNIYTMMTNYKKILECEKNISEATKKEVEAKANINSARNEFEKANNIYIEANNYVIALEEERNAILSAISKLEKDVKDKQTEMTGIADRLKNAPDLTIEKVKIPSMKQTISTMADKATSYVSLFDSIKELFKELTKKMSTVKTSTGELAIDQEEKNILTLLSSISSNVTKLAKICTNLESLRNEMYFIDYVVDKNTYLASQTERSHFFELAEVEYIIYGFDNQGANVAAAIGSIYGIRFIIDTLDYFCDPASPPELISRIAWAIGKGAVKAGLDIVDMLIDPDGKGAPGCSLTPSIKNVKLSYSDHLRIFLLLNAATSKTALKNTISTTLVEKGSKPMNEMYTQIHGKVDVELNLLFIPLFGSDLIPSDCFTGGKYVIHEEIIEGYE